MRKTPDEDASTTPAKQASDERHSLELLQDAGLE
jgi:hypothetical protein